MIEKSIALYHLIQMILTMTYIFWRNLLPLKYVKTFDFGYMYFIYLMFLSWLIFSGECCVSLLYKKIINNEQPYSLVDIETTVGQPILQVLLLLVNLLSCITFLYLSSIYDMLPIGILFVITWNIYLFDINIKKYYPPADMNTYFSFSYPDIFMNIVYLFIMLYVISVTARKF